MRLAVLNLTGGGVSGGYKKYLVRLLPLLEKKDTALKTLCAAPAAMRQREWMPALERATFSECRPFSPFFGASDPVLAGTLDAFGPDLLFAPLERFYDYPGRPYVCMLVNMAPVARNYSRGSLLESARHFIQRRHARAAVQKATHVVVTSKFVGSFLSDEWGVEPSKISVIYPGAEVVDGPEVLRPAQLARAGWDRFFWTVGSIERYRGLEDIFGAMRSSGLEQAKLVVCGVARPQMASYAAALRAEAERTGLSGRVLWVSGLTEGELSWCYRNAEAFIMTSRIEAGPNTALEAMAAGAVTIAADNPPLPEFFGETALYYRPGDHAALAARMLEVRDAGRNAREASSAAALARSKTFSWECAADKTLELFRSLAGAGG